MFKQQVNSWACRCRRLVSNAGIHTVVTMQRDFRRERRLCKFLQQGNIRDTQPALAVVLLGEDREQ